MRALGIVLIIAGILMMVFRNVSFTNEKKLVDVGPVEINQKETKKVGWPLYAGAVTTIAGVIVLVAAGKKRYA